MISKSQIHRAATRLGAMVLTLALTGAASAAEGSSWKYGPDGSDAAWGGTCESGRTQSPINIPSWNDLGGNPVRPISLNYAATDGATISNNGHTIVVTVPDGNTLTIGDETYTLAQFHFHTPSEHLKRGHRSPMEAHLVHVDKAGNPKLVVGVLITDKFKESPTPTSYNSPVADKMLSGLPLPANKGEEIKLNAINLMDLMPIFFDERRNEHTEYSGSLTTPGCNEGLTWIVMGYDLHTTPEVIANFQKIMGDNHREEQALNGRKIKCCGPDVKLKFQGN
jgi:carbonic anhydrase